MLSQEIHALTDVGDDRFLRREGQAALLEKGFYQGLDLGLQQRPVSAGDEEIIRIPYEMHLGMRGVPGREVPSQEPLQTVQGAIGEDRRKRTTLGGAALRGIESTLFAVASLEPTVEQLRINDYVVFQPSLIDRIEAGAYITFEEVGG
jgi:hypothetical protein